MTELYEEGHCSRWSGIPQNRLNNENRRHIEMLCRSFRTGVYNLHINWDRANYGSSWTIVTVGWPRLSTYDFDVLTQLVLYAHHECVRIDIAPKAFRYLQISFHSRQSRDGNMAARHPTIEQALEHFKPLPTSPSGDGE